MTSTRVIRGTKAKVFLYVCAILIITGLIAYYNNTLFQIDEIKKANDVCHQQEENLSTQLQVISDYKQRLEKSLKTEKADHQRTKSNLENRLNEERSKSEKLSSDTELKYSSLLQHFNLLQTEHDDFKEDCSKTQQKQLEEINDLQSKLNEVQEQLKKVESSKINLKTENDELRAERDGLKKAFSEKDEGKRTEEAVKVISDKYDQLKEEFNSYKETCKVDTVSQKGQKILPNSQNVSPANSQSNNHDNKVQNKVLDVPPLLMNPNKISSVSMSSTARSVIKPSQGVLNGARPILGPSVTPETLVGKKVDILKIQPEEVAPIPLKKENEPPELVNNRYQNQIDKAKDEVDKENGAHEVFDAPVGQNINNAFDGIGFGDNEPKQGDKPNFDKKHIDQMGNFGLADKDRNNKQYDQEYKEHDVQLEQEGDDDADGDYVDRDNARQQDPAVRN